MHASLDAAAVPLRVRDELDALAVDVRRSDADLVGNRAEDRQLVGGVETIDVVAGVGLRVTRHLSFFDRSFEWQTVGAHSPEHEVRGAVDDRRKTLDAV